MNIHFQKREGKGEERGRPERSVTTTKNRALPEITEMIESLGMDGTEGKPERPENAGIKENRETRGTRGIHGTVAETTKKAVTRESCVPQERHTTIERESVETPIKRKNNIWRKHVAMEDPMAEKRVLALKQGQTQEVNPEMNPERLEEVEGEPLNYQTRV